MNFNKLMYKGKEIKFKPDDTVATILRLRKDNRTLDLRYKSNKDFIKATEWHWFDKFMQKIAVKLGSTKGFGGHHIFWKHWLNPWYQFHRILWKVNIHKPYKL